jgi:hypothetical protein
MIYWSMMLLDMLSMCDTYMFTQQRRVDDVISRYIS